MALQFADRVLITIAGQPYLADGYIANFDAVGDYSGSLVNGNTSNGVASGFVNGNKNFTLSWTEYYVNTTLFTDIISLIDGNPNAINLQLMVQPFTVGQTDYTFPAMVFTGLALPNGLNIMKQTSQGQAMTRDIKVLAMQSALI